MAQLKIPYDGKEYVLEYTRRTVGETERKGFAMDEIGSKPVTMIPLLWEGAFLAHHRNAAKQTMDAMWKQMTNKKSLIGALTELYAAPVLALIGEDEDDAEEEQGNANWTLA